MTTESAIVLTVIVLAFSTFGAVLAWADARTRALSR
jgi:hypothetical protein